MSYIHIILFLLIGFIVGSFITFIIVIIADKFHKHCYNIISEQYVYDAFKNSCYELITAKCEICGKIKVFKVKK